MRLRLLVPLILVFALVVGCAEKPRPASPRGVVTRATEEQICITNAAGERCYKINDIDTKEEVKNGTIKPGVEVHLLLSSDGMILDAAIRVPSPTPSY